MHQFEVGPSLQAALDLQAGRASFAVDEYLVRHAAIPLDVGHGRNCRARNKLGRPARVAPFEAWPGGPSLSFRELEAASRLSFSVFLALDHAGVAGQEAALLEDPAQRRLE